VIQPWTIEPENPDGFIITSDADYIEKLRKVQQNFVVSLSIPP
jgi:hypothetical protein